MTADTKVARAAATHLVAVASQLFESRPQPLNPGRDMPRGVLQSIEQQLSDLGTVAPASCRQDGIDALWNVCGSTMPVDFRRGQPFRWPDDNQVQFLQAGHRFDLLTSSAAYAGCGM